MPSSGVQKCARSEEHTSELQSHDNLVCRLLLEKTRQRRLDRTQPKRAAGPAPAPPGSAPPGVVSAAGGGPAARGGDRFRVAAFLFFLIRGAPPEPLLSSPPPPFPL